MSLINYSPKLIRLHIYLRVVYQVKIYDFWHDRFYACNNASENTQNFHVESNLVIVQNTMIDTTIQPMSDVRALYLCQLKALAQKSLLVSNHNYQNSDIP